MHQPPAQVVKQSVESVLADLTAQQKRLADAITWVSHVKEGVRGVLPRGQIDFTTTTFVTATSRSAEIALTLPTPNGVQDVPTFSIVGSLTPQEVTACLGDPSTSLEALQQTMHQRWLTVYQTRPFEVWLVPDRLIWRGGETETVQWLTRQVRQWVEYWFHQPITAAYRPRKNLEIVRG